MNNLMPIHNCVQVAFENEKLIKLNSMLQRENECLREQVESYKHSLNKNNMIDVCTQVSMHASYYDKVLIIKSI